MTDAMSLKIFHRNQAMRGSIRMDSQAMSFAGIACFCAVMKDLGSNDTRFDHLPIVNFPSQAHCQWIETPLFETVLYLPHCGVQVR